MERHNSTTRISITNFLDAGALLRHRDQWVLIEGPFTSATEENHGEITITYPSFYSLSSREPLVGAKSHSLSSEALQTLLKEFLDAELHESQAAPLGKAPWLEPLKADFQEAFNGIQLRITQKEISKAVPAVFARSAQSVTAAERAQILLNLIQAPSTLSIYGFWHHGWGVLGATPEVLFEYSRGTVETMALAGTCPKTDQSTRLDLLDDVKERGEHQLVIDDIVSVMSRLGRVEVAKTEVVELPTLYHLKTNISVHCEEMPNFKKLMASLHPTPALGVSPREYGYLWMQDFPGQKGRDGFGGPFMFHTPQQAICLVAIRSLQWTPQESMIGSGCGIVAASEIEREWRELYQKRYSVRKILGLQL